ncbi:hypothetical protein RMATCC62417_16081 [Rhizopus microsporus]|nr:hypothetical protein RMATCC62417_16081 [Rhizopus microsporus]
MPNGILHATGYSKFTAKTTPHLVPSALNALNADALFLFAIFCTKTKQQKTRAITQDAFKCIDRVENIKIGNSLLKSSKITLSSTDNRLVTMSETVGFDMKSFKLHLGLYNKYSALENLSEENNADIDTMELTVANINMLNYYVSEQETSDSTIQMSRPPYMQLPRPFKVLASEVDYKNGAQKYRKQLERAEKTTISNEKPRPF